MMRGRAAARDRSAAASAVLAPINRPTDESDPPTRWGMSKGGGVKAIAGETTTGNYRTDILLLPLIRGADSKDLKGCRACQFGRSLEISVAAESLASSPRRTRFPSAWSPRE